MSTTLKSQDPLSRKGGRQERSGDFARRAYRTLTTRSTTPALRRACSCLKSQTRSLGRGGGCASSARAICMARLQNSYDPLHPASCLKSQKPVSREGCTGKDAPRHITHSPVATASPPLTASCLKSQEPVSREGCTGNVAPRHITHSPAATASPPLSPPLA